MKKQIRNVALIGALVAGSSAIAQTPVGTVVSNFTLTDINGGTHDLFSYLDAGKTVVIDVSATWCGPCWNYHNTHALNDFNIAHGPSGDNTAVVLFIEGDPTTTTAELHGSGPDTQGDWVTGETMPIIDLVTAASFENSGLDIAYFPVMYVICPNRTVLKSGVAGAIGTLNLLNSYLGQCPPPASESIDVAAMNYTGTLESCDGNYTPKVRIQNYGLTALTNATITISSGSTTLSTGTFTGNLATYGVAEVTCTDITGFVGGNVDIVVTTNADANAVNSLLTTTLAAPATANYNIVVKVFTDNYPGETTWEIRNSANTVVASGGPYQGNGGNAGGVDALKTMTHNVVLPVVDDCYSVTLKDSYGDGMMYGTNPAGQFGLEIVSAGNAIFNMDVEDFGTSIKKDASMKTDATSVGIVEAEAAVFNVYPNPASENVNVAFLADGDYEVSLLDIQGRALSSASYTNLSGNQTIAIPVSEVAPGNYFVKVTVNGVSAVQSVIVK